MRRGIWLVLAVALGCTGSTAASSSQLQQPESLRQDYHTAQQALENRQLDEYRRLRSGLDSYPLAIYLDYYALRRQPTRVTRQQAQDFVNASVYSPLTNRFLGGYLDRAGQDRRWDDFLALMPQEPNTIELKCYYFRARLAGGDTATAWEGARRLWIHGESRPKACDPLFAAWMKAGQLDDTAVWGRMLLAFDARQRSLMRYVSRQASPALKPWAEHLQTVYASPDGMRKIRMPLGDPHAADIVSRGLAYLARYRPERALDYWLRYQGEMSFSPEQIHSVESAIALRSLFAKSDANRSWLDGALARLGDDTLVEIRLRWALEEQDWNGMDQALQWLSAEGRQASVWHYWQARIWEQRGESELARGGFAALAGERDYYGFLAADRLGLPYQFNEQAATLSDEERAALTALPAVQRTAELIYHDEPNNAHAEWYGLLNRFQDQPQQLLALGRLAMEEGWFRMAIDAANRAEAWDALALRFPTPYADTFERYGGLRKVPGTELMAIARRESAFYPLARSPVGARGLMQIMPATGKQVARGLGVADSTAALFQVDYNVMLGSAYYRELLDRFSGNRVFALTAYNAGPHRVDRWRRKAGDKVPVEVWAETIPYRETRNYVQAVLAYNVVFQHLRGQAPDPVLSPAERAAGY
ncbi:transglycosylase SLT domain-containing protein [Parahaliea mediterranea]|uniref:transglycosylase SLT domain-containing protein n=1 Tax=Parahaliea mediterranea TaxID=651086 RepID=UPI001475B409|nr:transglycosylase SLT domain-containing protein [Parahaliea mediterranea]